MSDMPKRVHHSAVEGVEEHRMLYLWKPKLMYQQHVGYPCSWLFLRDHLTVFSNETPVDPSERLLSLKHAFIHIRCQLVQAFADPFRTRLRCVFNGVPTDIGL